MELSRAKSESGAVGFASRDAGKISYWIFRPMKLQYGGKLQNSLFKMGFLRSKFGF
jgi:hypothetical protein